MLHGSYSTVWMKFQPLRRAALRRHGHHPLRRPPVQSVCEREIVCVGERECVRETVCPLAHTSPPVRFGGQGAGLRVLKAREVEGSGRRVLVTLICCASCIVQSFRSLHFEPSLDASSLRSEVIRSIKMLSLRSPLKVPRGFYDERRFDTMGTTRFDARRYPPWRQLRGKWMLSLVKSHTNATSKRWHLGEIDLSFAFNSTPGRFFFFITLKRRVE